MSTQSPRFPVGRTPEARRRAELAKIHIARAALGMSDDDYAALIGAISRGRTVSAGALNARERAEALAHFARCGWRARPARKAGAASGSASGAGGDRAITADAPQARKARALWLLLHALGEVRDPSERALAHYAKRVLKVDALQWSSELWRLIESLKDWAMRVLPARCAAMQARLEGRAGALPPEIADPVARAQGALAWASRKRYLFDEYVAFYQALDAAVQWDAQASEVRQ